MMIMIPTMVISMLPTGLKRPSILVVKIIPYAQKAPSLPGKRLPRVGSGMLMYSVFWSSPSAQRAVSKVPVIPVAL